MGGPRFGSPEEVAFIGGPGRPRGILDASGTNTTPPTPTTLLDLLRATSAAIQYERR